MTSRATFGLGVLGLAFWLAIRAAWAATPTNCTFPSPPDTFTAVSPGELITSTLANQIMCVLGKLATRSAATPRADVACTSGILVPKGQRISWTTATTTTLTGKEIVNVNVLDTAAPPRVEANGWSLASGNAVRVWLWNHDPNTDRLVRICTEIVKPSMTPP